MVKIEVVIKLLRGRKVPAKYVVPLLPLINPSYESHNHRNKPSIERCRQMRFLELLTGASALAATTFGFRECEIGQNRRFRRGCFDLPARRQHVTFLFTSPKPSTGSRKPLFNSTIPQTPSIIRSSHSIGTKSLTSDKFQKVERLIRAMRSPQEVNTWMNRLVPLDDTSIIPTNPFQKLTWRDEINFIRLLRSIDAIDAIFTFIIHFSQSSSVIVYNTALDALARARTSSTQRHEDCTRLIELMDQRGIRPTSYTFTCLLHSVDGPKATLETMEKIQSFYNVAVIGANIYEAAILASNRNPNDRGNKAGPSQSWETALNLFVRLRQGGHDPSPQTYEALLRACARAGQVRIALALLEEIKGNVKLQPIPSGIWDAVLNVCALTGRFNEALRVVHDMLNQGCRLSSAHCYRLLTLFAKTGKDKLALQILDAMTGKSTGLILGAHANNSNLLLTIPQTNPTLVMINAALAACARAGNDVDSFALFSRLQSGEFQDPKVIDEVLRPDELSYNTVLSSCKDPNKARELVKEVKNDRKSERARFEPHILILTIFDSLRCDYLDAIDTALYRRPM